MSVWPLHKLATEPQPEVVLRPGQKVETIVDLPGVPAGTKGKVTVANGFSWRRYSVLFANGERKSFLDARHIKAA